MSEFYAARRTQIADLSALACMGIAALGASLTSLKILAAGFRTGNLEPALLRFGAIVVVAALSGGGAGMLLGRWLGARWESRHRAHRPQTADDEVTQAPVAAEFVAGAFVVRELSAETQRSFALRERTPAQARWYGAWEGPRLVGVAPGDGRGSIDASRAAIDPGYDSAAVLSALSKAISP